ncbi:hypothetical protein BVRB_7g178140 [Beta vulgaris subsp. vulgaris]|nr:hypothetical protein BVRB_7g178140 [Beta vulgaris subsp. vulgaris]
MGLLLSSTNSLFPAKLMSFPASLRRIPLLILGNLWKGLDQEENHGFNRDSGNGFKVKSLSFCDFEDAQKIPTLRLGFNFSDSVKKLIEETQKAQI